MLLIRCPHCERERAEVEFAYAGEAHIDRPSDLRDTVTDKFLITYKAGKPRPTKREIGDAKK
jgi:sarcosine oxidase subunit delta